MKTLVMAIILVALFSVAFHELSKRDDHEREAIASPEISDPLPTKLLTAEQPVIKKLGLASKAKARKVSAVPPDPRPFLQETLQVYLPQEKRAVLIIGAAPDMGGALIDNPGEKLGELLYFANSSGAGHEAIGSEPVSPSDSGHEGIGSEPGSFHGDRDSDGLDRNRDKDWEDHAYRENGDDHEHSDRPERHHRE